MSVAQEFPKLDLNRIKTMLEMDNDCRVIYEELPYPIQTLKLSPKALLVSNRHLCIQDAPAGIHR